MLKQIVSDVNEVQKFIKSQVEAPIEKLDELKLKLESFKKR